MSDLKNKLDFITGKKGLRENRSAGTGDGISTKQKLEELVNKNLKNKSLNIKKNTASENVSFDKDFEILEYNYPMSSVFGKVVLDEWSRIKNNIIPTIFNNRSFSNIDPLKLIYFDTETTGLSGGTGTIPFMLGFGYIEGDSFEVRIFVLNDPSKEGLFLDEIDSFLKTIDISGVVTYNGKSFDYPLMETRYVLNRKKFPLQNFPHLDFLSPARVIWKNTYESRKLGYLGDILLNISRADDIDGSFIPGLYFEYLRTGNFSMIEKVVEHNALDIVGLSALLLLGCKYVDDVSVVSDEGEVLGVALLNERSGLLPEAEKIYCHLNEHAQRDEIIAQSAKRLALIKKKKKLFDEAEDLWRLLSDQGDKLAFREMSVYLEHRKKDFSGALEFVERGLEQAEISDTQRKDFEKRIQRLKRKITGITGGNN
ncbi:MAG: ribonuclease H-like domain-containing protein [Acidobacteriota bacterium]